MGILFACLFVIPLVFVIGIYISVLLKLTELFLESISSAMKPFHSRRD